ncbi:MAG: CIA30 family protein [Sulfitobacter litoralis]|uniref:Complex I intermediate-associated protein 30 (CIA30) n=1 Tax=Sulfitobacter litoralis TaxID=335975 RepID=A0ABY0RNZ8_9RHOB|nr:CIA30 family protein [Sulfitobacter litoralis]SDO22998.1 Complex I intermediate-associated protein 30 (CIA30) [Sulfitobacter litoralis]|tara:strand:- start:5866 stop:6345 length:480 start_codon:yes stop_codon:yes gene_type:complete
MKQLAPNWEFVLDNVMGGVSSGCIAEEIVGGRNAIVLRGTVSLENNGGFIQMAFDLHEGGTDVDVSAWDGIEIDAYGDGGTYDVRLRTAQLSRPWQSFRADFVSEPHWQKVKIPFSSLVSHRVDAAFDPTCLRRIGVLAIGRERDACIAVSNFGFYSAN